MGGILTEKERLTLAKIISFEGSLSDGVFDASGKFCLGWSWRDAQVSPSVLNNLIIKGCLETLFKSNSYTGYRLTDRGKVLLAEEVEETTEVEYAEDLIIPDDLFDVVEGYEEVKRLFINSLKGEPVDFLLVGVPGSAKTLALSELERVGGSTPIILGGTATKVGIIDVLFDIRPKLLLIDEFEHFGTKDYTVLLSLCESRVISETKHGKTRRLELPNTRMFASANSKSRIPLPVLDRLQVVHFPPYTEQEFNGVVVNVLVKRKGVEIGLAEYIAGATWGFSRSVRQAIRISKLANTKGEVDELLKVIVQWL